MCGSYSWMEFKSIAIIIGVPLVLYELPKYQDMIETQSALEKIIFVSCYSTYCCRAISTRHSPKNYFRVWLQYYYGAWVLKIFQLLLDPRRKEILMFLATLLQLWSRSRNINRQLTPREFVFNYCTIVHRNRKSSRKKIVPPKMSVP